MGTAIGRDGHIPRDPNAAVAELSRTGMSKQRPIRRQLKSAVLALVMREDDIVTGFTFPQLDDRTRSLMRQEFGDDSASGRVYVGKRLNADGERVYLDALPRAFKEGSATDLQAVLEPVPGELWIPAITAKNGRTSTTPYTAPQTLAEGEFNRYYMRAICIRAIDEGDGQVRVRRAKPVANERSDRLVKVVEGDVLDAKAVLDDIRRHPGEDTPLGMPRGPNSGLSLEFTPAHSDERADVR
jgi:hypothetical protein